MTDLVISSTSARITAEKFSSTAVQPKNPLALIARRPCPNEEVGGASSIEHGFRELARNWGKNDIEYRVNGKPLKVDLKDVPEDRQWEVLRDVFGAAISENFTWLKSDHDRNVLGQHIATYLQSPGIPYAVSSAVIHGTLRNAEPGAVNEDLTGKPSVKETTREIVDIRTTAGAVTINTYTSFDHLLNGSTPVPPYGPPNEAGTGLVPPDHPAMTIDSSFVCQIRADREGMFYALDWQCAGAIIETPYPELAETVRGERQSIWDRIVEYLRILCGSPYLTVREPSAHEVAQLREWRSGITDAKEVSRDKPTYRQMLSTSPGFGIERVLLEKKPGPHTSKPMFMPSEAVPAHVVSPVTVEDDGQPAPGFVSFPVPAGSRESHIPGPEVAPEARPFRPNTSSRKPAEMPRLWMQHADVKEITIEEVVIAPDPDRSKSRGSASYDRHADRGFRAQFRALGAL